MRLTIGTHEVALPLDSKISIEKKSPFNNDDTGAFSYPFSVPTLPNQQGLGWPGRLQRVGDVADQSFILEESGLQIMRGEVDYDEVTRQEIGIILQSGYTEFFKKMENKKLQEIDYGSEWFPPCLDYESAIYTKAEEWDTANTTDNGKYVVVPFSCQNGIVNTQAGGGVTYLSLLWQDGQSNFVSLQFKVNFVLTKIFESAGYVIVENSITGSVFDKLILFSRIINIFLYHIQTGGLIVNSIFDKEILAYSRLMPDIRITDFLDQLKNMLCITYEINESKKEVRIKFKKTLFIPENHDNMQMSELSGWIHKEQKALKGFTFRYASQDDELATYTDFPDFVDVVSVLPAPEKEDQIVCLASTVGRNRLYITTKDNDVLKWQEAGRLKECLVGDGENEVEIAVNVPRQIPYFGCECPGFSSISIDKNSLYTNVTFLAVTFYHGRKTFGSSSFPYASFDRYSLDGTIDTGISLKPIYLYDNFYLDFLNWQTYRARAFTKYVELSLVQLMNLQWGKRYNIDGIEIILDVISFDLPHYGVVKIDGFTA